MLNVEEWMTSPVTTVKPRDSVAHARQIMERERINQLPVVVRGRLVGIVTDRDLRDAFPSVLSIAGRRRRGSRRTVRTPEQITVEEVMTRNVLTLSPEDSIEEAARIMRKQRIGAVPILEKGEKGKMIGILARSDLLDACATLAERVRALGPGSTGPHGRASEEITGNW